MGGSLKAMRRLGTEKPRVDWASLDQSVERSCYKRPGQPGRKAPLSCSETILGREEVPCREKTRGKE